MDISLSSPFSIKRLTESSFVKNVATMLTGNVIAQLLGLLAAPVITRIYSPEQFGVMVFILSISGAFSIVACFRYRSAIVLPKKDKEGYNLLILSISAIILTSTSLMVLIALFVDQISSIAGFDDYRLYLIFIPVCVAFSSLRDVLVYFHTRLNKFRLIAISTIIVQVVTATTKIGAGLLFTASAYWLIIGNILGSFLSAIFLIAFIAYLFPDIKKNLKISNIMNTARDYYSFPRYNIPTNFINKVSQSLPVYLLALFFSNEVVGFYGLANMVLRKPVNLMSQALGKVFLQKSAEIENQGGDLYLNLKKTTLGLSVIGFLPFFILTLGGKWIFGHVFGEDWAEAGLYAQVLAPWLFLLFINQPTNQIYIVKQKLRFLMYFNYLYIIVRLVSLCLGYFIFHDPLYAVLFFSVSGVVANIYFIFNAFIITKYGG